MKICPIFKANYYSKNSNVKNNSAQKNNISFCGAMQYELAYDIYEKKESVKKINSDIEELSDILSRTVKEINNDINKKINEKISIEKKISELEKEYKQYNPTMTNFADDVEKGRNAHNESSYTVDCDSFTNWSPSDDRAVAFTPSDGFPCYTP